MAREMDFWKSPAVPAALLLYSIIFGFAAVYYLDLPWRRFYTVLLYLVVSVWAAVAIIVRWRNVTPRWNRVDICFVLFLGLVLLSIISNWWTGTIKQLELMPILFVLPYLLGRAMNSEDVVLFQKVLIWLGGALLLLIPFEYVRVLRHGLPYENSPAPMLFGQGHGVMLSGLLLAATFLTLVSVALRPKTELHMRLSGAWQRTAIYLGVGLIILVMGWISSRGPALAATISMIVLIVYSSRGAWKEKVWVAVVFLTFLALAIAHTLQDKHKSAYYALVTQKPAITENVGIAAVTKSSPTDSPAKSGADPILGKASCAAIVESVSDRWIHYQQAWTMFIAKPISGVGANRYGFHACTGPGSFPHSTMLQVMAELGVVGALIYATLIMMVVNAFLKMRFLETGNERLNSLVEWTLAFFALQFLVAQLNGDYFISAAFYFTCGLAASFLAQSASRREIK